MLRPLHTEISHALSGPVSGWSWGNGQTHHCSLGRDGEIQLIQSAIATTYSYDAAGRMTSDGLYTYTYDALGQRVAR